MSTLRDEIEFLTELHKKILEEDSDFDVSYIIKQIEDILEENKDERL